MRLIFLSILCFSLSSCSSFLLRKAEVHPSGNRPALRRADHGKYILDKSNGVGSRPLFIQPGGNKCLNSSKAVTEYLNENLHDRNREHTLILLLDKMNQLIKMEILEPDLVLDVDTCSQHVTQVAKENEADSVILVQCQPTKSSTPYQRDRSLSKQLQIALSPINVVLLDHLIMSKNQCFSFADNRML